MVLDTQSKPGTLRNADSVGATGKGEPAPWQPGSRGHRRGRSEESCRLCSGTPVWGQLGAQLFRGWGEEDMEAYFKVVRNY